MFNRDLFRAKCIEHGIRTQDAAQIMGINPATLSRKMGGHPKRDSVVPGRTASYSAGDRCYFFRVNLRLRNISERR